MKQFTYTDTPLLSILLEASDYTSKSYFQNVVSFHVNRSRQRENKDVVAYTSQKDNNIAMKPHRCNDHYIIVIIITQQ